LREELKRWEDRTRAWWQRHGAARVAAMDAGIRRIPRRAVVIAAAGLLGLVLVGWQRCGVKGCPSVDRLAAYQPGGAPVLLDRHGEAFAVLAPVQREIVPLDSLPTHVAQAFVAVEDQRFYEHGGIDARRVVGASLAVARAGSYVEGSSTITMQLARNLFPDRLPATKTMGRKLMEARVARGIEKRFSKDEILELYLNHIYFGAGVYGIAAASRHYFGRPASRLTLSQAALLAALPKAPSYYDPRRNPEAARSRRNLVLTLMAAQARIGEADAAAAQAAGLGLTTSPPARQREPDVAPWFVDGVKRVLEAELGDGLYSAPLRIHTTLDRGAQRAAEAALERQLGEIERGAHGSFSGARYTAGARGATEAPSYLQGAIVVMEAATGEVLALVGGRDYAQSGFNRAIDGRRQVGSAFKPFVFAAALNSGYAPSQHVADTPLRLELAGGEVWEPRNLTGGFEGEVTLRDALVRSKNVPAVRLAGAVGEREVARLARRAGVHSEIPELPSMALGTAVLSPLELIAAYTAFAGGGLAVEPRLVTRVENADGRTVWEAKARTRRVLAPAVAFLVNDMLADAVDHGTGTAVRRAGFRAPAAGKTGTTDGGTDAWFVGYTPELVGGVWIGFDRPAPISGDASGGQLAAPVWARMMLQIHRDRPAAGGWEPPGRVVLLPVDPATGLVLAEGCRPLRGQPEEEYFVRGTEPASACPDGAERQRGPGFLARVAARTRHFWHQARGWALDRLGRQEPEPVRAERERILGTQRLPRAAEIRQPELDSAAYPRPLGIPVDELEPPQPPDTTRLPGDTVAPPPPDTVAPPAPDTLPRPPLPPPVPVPVPPVPPPVVPPPDTLARG
jgi:penicillin-binding protein 1A